MSSGPTHKGSDARVCYDDRVVDDSDFTPSVREALRSVDEGAVPRALQDRTAARIEFAFAAEPQRASRVWLHATSAVALALFLVSYLGWATTAAAALYK